MEPKTTMEKVQAVRSALELFDQKNEVPERIALVHAELCSALTGVREGIEGEDAKDDIRGLILAIDTVMASLWRYAKCQKQVLPVYALYKKKGA